MGLHSTLEELATRLDRAGCRWALIGGVALALAGHARTTFDIDLLVDEDDLAKLDACLAELGYGLVYRWIESSHYTATAGAPPIDVLHARRPSTRGMLERARSRILPPGATMISVVETEDLIGLKIQAFRNDPERRRGDLVDIRALIEVATPSGELDMGRVTEYFALFGEQATLAELLVGVGDADR